MQKPVIHKLENGLTIVAARTDGNVTYSGMLCNAGSRDDFVGLDGLAHFVEHTIFKGTPTRSSIKVANTMERVGGYLNAYTGKEQIMLYTGAPTGYEENTFALFSDLVDNALFPSDEIERERDVIVEEIHSYHDSPSDAVFDEFDELFYAGTPLAHNILGYNHTVRKITRDDARRFLTSYFTPGNMILYCLSPVDPDKIIKRISPYFRILRHPDFTEKRRTPVDRSLCEPFDELHDRGNEQANTVIGYHTFGACDDRRFALFLLSNILGGPALNSLLNREMREKRGLVYTVETSVTLYGDTGNFQVYFGTEPDNVRKCTSIFTTELNKLADKPMGPLKFDHAKKQLCGQLLVSGENKENAAMAMAKSLMRHGETRDNEYTSARIRELSAGELRDMAQLIAESPFNRLTLT